MGFVDLTQPFEVFYSDDGNQLLAITDTNAVLQTDAAAYALNAETGRVTLFGSIPIPAQPFRGIAIHYTAGFAVDDHEIAQNVPLALKNGAATVAASLMRTHSSTPNKQSPWVEMQSALRRAATGILSAYIRPRVSGDDPQFAEVL